MGTLRKRVTMETKTDDALGGRVNELVTTKERKREEERERPWEA